MVAVRYGGKAYKLHWDIYAHDRILLAAHDAGCHDLGEWQQSDPSAYRAIVLYELICGGIRKHNYAIDMGFSGGKKIKMPDVPDEKRMEILSLMRACDVKSLDTVFSLCWAEANHVVIPEELREFMPDEDYLEIAAELEANKPESEKN